jgi:hypothetical protein
MAKTIHDHKIEELNKVIGEFSNDETPIIAIPGQVKNNGKLVDALHVVIGHAPSKKKFDYTYRGLSSNFREWMKEKIDNIKRRNG